MPKLLLSVHPSRSWRCLMSCLKVSQWNVRYVSTIGGLFSPHLRNCPIVALRWLMCSLVQAAIDLITARLDGNGVKDGYTLVHPSPGFASFLRNIAGFNRTLPHTSLDVHLLFNCHVDKIVWVRKSELWYRTAWGVACCLGSLSTSLIDCWVFLGNILRYRWYFAVKLTAFSAIAKLVIRLN
jgi:hypothetical protein